MGIDQREIENLNKMNDGYNKNIALVRAVSAERSSLGRIEAMTRTLIPGFDITADNAADVLGDAMNKNLVEFEKLGEQFGMGKDEIQVLKDWAQVVASNVNVSKALDTTLLESKMSDDERTAAIKENSKKLAGKSGKDLSKILMDNVATSESIAKSLNTTSDQLITDLNSSDTKTRKKAEEGVKEQLSKMDSGLDNSKRIMADAAALKEKKDNERLEKQRRYMTKSIMEAIELILQKLIEKIYLVLEKVWGIIQRFLPPIVLWLKKGFTWILKGLSFLPKIGDGLKPLVRKMEIANKLDEVIYKENLKANEIEEANTKYLQGTKTVERFNKLKESGEELDPSEQKQYNKAVEDRKKAMEKLKGLHTTIYDAEEKISKSREKAAYLNENREKLVARLSKKGIAGKFQENERMIEMLSKARDKLNSGVSSVQFKEGGISQKMSDVGSVEAVLKKYENRQLSLITGSKAGGGFLGGASMSGDKLAFAGNSGELVLNRPQQMTLGKKIYDLAQGKPAGFGAAGATGGGGIGKQINDNRQITINVNQRDKETIKNIVYNALYEDKM